MQGLDGDAIEIRGMSVPRMGQGTYPAQGIGGLSLRISRESSFLLAGSARAGKTQILRTIATLQPIPSGDVLVLGLDVNRQADAVRALVGYMPVELGHYPGLTVLEHLRIQGAAHGLASAARDTLIADLLELVDLAPLRHQSLDSLSLDGKQRVNLARTLLPDPAVLLLDEPLRGLEPDVQRELTDILCDLRSLGKTIVLTADTSTLEAESMDWCTDAALLRDGRACARGTVAVILDSMARPCDA